MLSPLQPQPEDKQWDEPAQRRDKKIYVETPVEVIDFINRSVKEIVKQEFGKDLSDPDVKLIDPFAGEGQFICRAVKTGVITKEAGARAEQIELNPERAALCRANTQQATGYQNVNVRQGDSFLMSADDGVQN